jgi:hypothetical protein
VQCASIYQSHGLHSAAEFMKYLLDSSLGYAQLWSQFFQMALLLGKQRPPETREDGQETTAIMMMGVWCLFGNYQLEGAQACPTVRFESLQNHLVDDYQDPRNWKGSVAEIWDYWDMRIGSIPWRHALAELLSSNQRGLNVYEEVKKYWEGSVPDVITTVFSAFVADQRQIIERLLKDPEQVIIPRSYLNSQEEVFPTPYLKVELDGFAVPKSWLTPHFRSLWDVNLNNQIYSTRFVSQSRGSKDDGELLESMLQMEDLLNWCDLAFSDHVMPWEVFENTRRNLEEWTQKRVLLIV